MNDKALKATSSLVGTIIGAGIFGVPFVMAQAGFVAGTVLFLLLTIAMLVMHLMYAEVVERSGAGHRLTGYMEMYFGKRAKNFAAFSVVVAVYGSLVVYILIANEFLNTLFGELFSARFGWGAVFWIILSVGIVRGIKTVSKTETILLGLLGLVLLSITVKGLPLVSVPNLSSFNFRNIFLPYGVILFSLAGFQAIPEMRVILGKDGKTFKKAVTAGILFSAAATMLFSFVVVGVSGETTSPEAISGLEQFLGREIVFLGTAFGLIAIATTYLIMGVNIKESFMYDWNIKRWKSDFMVIAAPMALIFLGVNNFIDVIGVVGAVLGAVNGLMVAMLFVAAKKKNKGHSLGVSFPKVVLPALILVLVLGGFYEIIKVMIG